ncbi:MAG: magnesium chelatase subunit D family protein [Actinomycetota bacterium]|nr:magnesium chelatase subunit D family protein [Actinomycetota bacterium]
MKQGFILYPFSAIVGQEKMKRALLVNAVDLHIGGLLIRGERGTCKSTAARALADLLPDIEIVADCPFSCDPACEDEMCQACRSRWESREPLPLTTRPMRFTTLPLNASEDRVVGTLDMEKAVKEGVKDFEPGILADANRSILYVDEVNLLDDHIVDLLLDAAAMGVNMVEREGVSYSHPSSFIMVGTMNPEEGELRPQLEDRFGLCVEVAGEKKTAARMEVVRRRHRFTADPRLFRSEFQASQDELRQKVLEAREALPRIELSDEMLKLVSHIAVELGVCGHRADIATCQAARALAALEGSTLVEEKHIREAAEMALLHRLRKTPFDDQIKDLESLDRIIERKGKLIDLPLQDNSLPEAREEEGASDSVKSREAMPVSSRQERAEAAAEELEVPVLEGTAVKASHRMTGKRSGSITNTNTGKHVGSRLPRPDEGVDMGNLALDATLRAAAGRTAGSEESFNIRKEDLRTKIRRRKVGNLILFVLDASASMGCQDRMESTKQVVNQLLVEAYQKRDRVGLITFRDDGAQLALSPTSSVQLAKLRIRDLATGGATPLNHGLALAYQVVKMELRRDPDIALLLVLITDGHGNVGYASQNPLRESLEIAEKMRGERLNCLVFDTSSERTLIGMGRAVKPQARRIAEAMGAEYHHLSSFKPQEILRRLEKKLT